MDRIPIERTTEDASFFDLQVQLDGVTYTLEFRWNVRCESWFMAIWDADHSFCYQAGLRLVSNWPLELHAADPVPNGNFFIIDTANDASMAEDPGFDDLGNRHVLFYESAG